MSELVAQLRPHRWKVFQALPIKGENDDVWDELEITSEEFRAWVARHERLEPVVESNELMTGSYCMLDGKLRFYNNVGGEFKRSAPIPEVGMDRAWSEIESMFSDDVFEDRGGVWSWEVSK